MIEKPTLQHVADLAGVSLASASRALAGQTASPATVKKVRFAAKKLGYVPDSTARSLRFGGTRQVVFAVDDIGNPNYVEMLRAIEQEIGSVGYRLNVTATGRDIRSVMSLVRSLTGGFGDGLIISPLRVNAELRRALQESSIPVVVIGRLDADAAIDRVGVDSAQALELAVDHLFELGKRRIAFVNGPLDTNPGSARRRGFLAASERLGLAVDEQLIVQASDFTAGAGKAATEILLARTEFDAIVGANDLIAMGAISACVAAGVDVPGHVAVTGMDDTEIASIYNPPLTSVSLLAAERGRLAARLLLQRFADPARAPETLTVNPFLTIRESSTVKD